MSSDTKNKKSAGLALLIAATGLTAQAANARLPDASLQRVEEANHALEQVKNAPGISDEAKAEILRVQELLNDATDSAVRVRKAETMSPRCRES